MSKERLEEIADLLAKRDVHIKDGEIDYPNYDKFVYMLNDEGHIDWLLKYAKEQAERVQVLEQQNNRYREALDGDGE